MSNRHDAFEMIKQIHDRKKTVKKISFLNPTKASLYGLELRFRATEGKMDEEKKKLRVRNYSTNSNSPDKTILNRHALPEEFKILQKPMSKDIILKRKLHNRSYTTDYDLYPPEFVEEENHSLGVTRRNENRDTLPILKHPPIGSILEDKDKNAINLTQEFSKRFPSLDLKRFNSSSKMSLTPADILGASAVELLNF